MFGRTNKQGSQDEDQCGGDYICQIKSLRVVSFWHMKKTENTYRNLVYDKSGNSDQWGRNEGLMW